MRKAETQERQQYEAARLALAEAPDQALGKKAGQNLSLLAEAELPASSAKSRAHPSARLAPARHAGCAELTDNAQRLLSPVTPPQPGEEPVRSHVSAVCFCFMHLARIVLLPWTLLRQSRYISLICKSENIFCHDGA